VYGMVNLLLPEQGYARLFLFTMDTIFGILVTKLGNFLEEIPTKEQC
jgi:hypothetical protein